MKWKTLLITIVMNIFLMLFVTVMMEYINLTDRFISLEDVVSTSVDAALSLSVGSEEMFSDKFQANMTSRATYMEGAKKATNTYASTMLCTSDGIYQVNIYELAKYYERNHGEIPRSKSDVDTLPTQFSAAGETDETKAIFEWIYGTAGSDYADDSLKWANRNETKKSEYATMHIGARGSTNPHGDAINSNFLNFYKEIGHKQETLGYLKTWEDIDSYKLQLVKYPVLYNMGFKEFGGHTTVGSHTTFDNFTSTCHVGKSYRNDNGAKSHENTLYYLTPMSLGVTYVPIEILKPAIVANIDTNAKLKSISGASTSVNGAKSFEDSVGCIPTAVYTNMGSTHVQHTSDSSDIVNDGLVEYDLESLKVKIDYFFIDFGNIDKARGGTIVSRLNGQISQAMQDGWGRSKVDYGDISDQMTLRQHTLDKFLDDDTALNVNKTEYSNQYKDIRGQRIIAKVTVKLKVHIPYQSSVIQWACQRFTPGGDPQHFSVKLWDVDSNQVQISNDGTWFQYTTFFMQSRA